MALDILKRLIAYLEPLGFLAIGAYGTPSPPPPPARFTHKSHAPSRRNPRAAGDRDLANPAQRYPQSEQNERPCLRETVA